MTALQLSHRVGEPLTGRSSRAEEKCCIEKKRAINPRITTPNPHPKTPREPIRLLMVKGSVTDRTAPRDAAAPPPNTLGPGVALPTRGTIKLSSVTCWHLPGARAPVPKGCSLCWPCGHTMLAQLLRGCPGTTAPDSDTRCREGRLRHKGLMWNT